MLGFSLGASEYLMKPVDRRNLLGILQKYIPEDEVGEAMIMVVEDELPTVQMMTKLLKKDGYGVAHAIIMNNYSFINNYGDFLSII